MLCSQPPSSSVLSFFPSFPPFLFSRKKSFSFQTPVITNKSTASSPAETLIMMESAVCVVCVCVCVSLHQSGVDVDVSSKMCGGQRGLTRSGHAAPRGGKGSVCVCVCVSSTSVHVYVSTSVSLNICVRICICSCVCVCVSVCV